MVSIITTLSRQKSSSSYPLVPSFPLSHRKESFRRQDSVCIQSTLDSALDLLPQVGCEMPLIRTRRFAYVVDRRSIRSYAATVAWEPYAQLAGSNCGLFEIIIGEHVQVPAMCNFRITL